MDMTILPSKSTYHLQQVGHGDKAKPVETWGIPSMKMKEGICFMHLQGRDRLPHRNVGIVRNCQSTVSKVSCSANEGE